MKTGRHCAYGVVSIRCSQLMLWQALSSSMHHLQIHWQCRPVAKACQRTQQMNHKQIKPCSSSKCMIAKLLEGKAWMSEVCMLLQPGQSK